MRRPGGSPRRSRTAWSRESCGWRKGTGSFTKETPEPPASRTKLPQPILPTGVTAPKGRGSVWPSSPGRRKKGLRETPSRGSMPFFKSADYAAAEPLARWHVRFHGAGSLPEDLPRRADRVLRARGGAALADAVFGSAPARASLAAGRPTAETLRRLRAAVAAALAGEESEAPLAELGLTGLSVSSKDGREVVAFGVVAEGVAHRRLEAGAANYELALSPALPEEETTALALLLETLLFRLTAPAPPSDFSEGW